jgi:hypothetical protein
MTPSPLPNELVLGHKATARVPEADQRRQRQEVVEILSRLRRQPGVVLADEVGMGKTFVALAVAYSVAATNLRGPVVVMVPPNLIDKWEQDLATFCELYLEQRTPRRVGEVPLPDLLKPTTVRYGVARHSIDLMKLLDDSPRERAQLIFLAQGAMTRRHGDKWIGLALIAEALRRHGRGKARRLIQVKAQIHRFVAELLWAIGEERAHDEGDALWARLLRADPSAWRGVYNSAAKDRKQLQDDPVPKQVVRALQRVDLNELADALEKMPIRAVGGDDRVSDRVKSARRALNDVERGLWADVLRQTRWRSPLLVIDEAHHLKNPGASLARQLQSPDSDADLKTGDGAMAGAFERMLFLTATPFQLGHHELVRVLERFGDVRWDEAELGPREVFTQRLGALHEALTTSQRCAVALQRSWSRLRPEDADADVDAWWSQVSQLPLDSLNSHQRSVIEAFAAARHSRDLAEAALRPWVLRHNKGSHWSGTMVVRRNRLHGTGIDGAASPMGLPIPGGHLLPFFLAARSAMTRDGEVLGEALCSSYEAFRRTRQEGDASKDDEDGDLDSRVDLSHSRWFLDEFDRALDRTRGATHPKMMATVRKAVDLWESGEKVLVFAFYRHTCRALRLHISDEIERRVLAGTDPTLIERAQKRFFDDTRSPGRRALDEALRAVVEAHTVALDAVGVSPEQRDEAVDGMRRFLRPAATLVRCFPLADVDGLDPADVVRIALDKADASGATWSQKFGLFLDFLTRCSSEERKAFLDATLRTETGRIRVEDDEDEHGEGIRETLANVQVVTGKTKRPTRARLMRAFNTPFFPDILVCSEVMGEGVDLQRFCRHVIHHDLAWNPSTIEQRTGRIDRLGCKAEGRNPIVVYLPYLAGTADERQYHVMSNREQWFRVVMGQEEVAKLIAKDSADGIPLPATVSEQLAFRLGLKKAADSGSCERPCESR